MRLGSHEPRLAKYLANDDVSAQLLCLRLLLKPDAISTPPDKQEVCGPSDSKQYRYFTSRSPTCSYLLW